jgi:type IX secretion system protein PorV
MINRTANMLKFDKSNSNLLSIDQIVSQMRNYMPFTKKLLYSIFGIVLVFAVALTNRVHAQGAASTAVPFVLISPDARTSAMGESGVAVADDASAVYWNPAGLGFQYGQEARLSHSNWLPQFQQSDLYYEYANYKIHIPEIGGTVGAGFTYLNLGEFERRDEANTNLGTFKSYEMALAVSYGTRLDEDMSVGVGLKLIHSSLSNVATAEERGSGTATTVAGDIGFLYRPSKFVLPFTDEDIGDRFAVGLALSNMGPTVAYIDADQGDPLPTTLRFGVKYDVVHEEFNRLTWTADVTKIIVSAGPDGTDDFFTALGNTWETQGDGSVINEFTLGTGFEYWYSNLVAMRFGFFHEDPNQGNRRFLTFGVGIRYDIYGFDFSYISTSISDESSPLSETLRFTLGIIWDTTGVPPDDSQRIPADDSAN